MTVRIQQVTRIGAIVRRRFGHMLDDLRHGRLVDLYAAAVVTLVFAALLVVGADLPDGARWSVLFAGLGFLLLRAAFANHREDRLLDRGDYDRHPITGDLRTATEVWIFAPSSLVPGLIDRITMVRDVLGLA